VITSCLSCKRLVGDVLEGLSDLGSIVSLSRSDKLKSIMSVSLRQLGRISTNRLLQVRTMFSVKLRDGADVYASR